MTTMLDVRSTIWPRAHPEVITRGLKSSYRLAGFCLATMLVMSAPLAAQETRSMAVLGSITAEIGGEQLEWLTIAGDIDGIEQATAVWRPHVSAIPAALAEQMERMSEQQRAIVAQALGGASSPLGDSDDTIELRMAGFDPDADRMLREGVFSIDLTPFSADDLDAALAMSHNASVS